MEEDDSVEYNLSRGGEGEGVRGISRTCLKYQTFIGILRVSEHIVIFESWCLYYYRWGRSRIMYAPWMNQFRLERSWITFKWWVNPRCGSSEDGERRGKIIFFFFEFRDLTRRFNFKTICYFLSTIYLFR